MNTKTLATAAATACLAAGAAQAAHADLRQPLAVHVRISDLDLSKPTDVQQLYIRLSHAAEVACDGGTNPLFAVYMPAQQPTCRQATLDAALGQFQEPLVVSVRANLKAMKKLPTP